MLGTYGEAHPFEASTHVMKRHSHVLNDLVVEQRHHHDKQERSEYDLQQSSSDH
jgi:hypothetical protein